MKKIYTILLFSILLTMKALSQDSVKIEPPDWWIGMEDNTLQLMVYGKNVAKTQPELNYKKFGLSTTCFCIIFTPL